MTDTKTINFSYPQSNEVKDMIKRMTDTLSLHNQTQLISALRENIEIQGFYWDYVENLYIACEEHNRQLCDDCEESDQEIQEIYMWYSANLSDYELEKLNQSSIPYINNEYGTWIGRSDFGSAWDIYFLPSLAEALYN